jgi:hypothetical protein
MHEFARISQAIIHAALKSKKSPSSILLPGFSTCVPDLSSR